MEDSNSKQSLDCLPILIPTDDYECIPKTGETGKCFSQILGIVLSQNPGFLCIGFYKP